MACRIEQKSLRDDVLGTQIFTVDKEDQKCRMDQSKEELYGLRLALKVSVQTQDFRSFIRGGQGLLKVVCVFIYIIKNKNLKFYIYIYIYYTLYIKPCMYQGLLPLLVLIHRGQLSQRKDNILYSSQLSLD